MHVWENDIKSVMFWILIAPRITSDQDSGITLQSGWLSSMTSFGWTWCKNRCVGGWPAAPSGSGERAGCCRVSQQHPARLLRQPGVAVCRPERIVEVAIRLYCDRLYCVRLHYMTWHFQTKKITLKKSNRKSNYATKTWFLFRVSTHLMMKVPTLHYDVIDYSILQTIVLYDIVCSKQT